jgi:hypothetical protein
MSFAMPAPISRRRFLQSSSIAAGVSFGAASLGNSMLGSALGSALASTEGKRPKSVIMIHLSGGPSHLDMYDMKPDSPVEYRGEFRPIRTNVPGMEICELMPEQAKIADKFAIVRGVQLIHPLHTGNEFYSGYPWQENPRAIVPGEARRPALGSIVSRFRTKRNGLPPYVSIENHFDWERAYYAGLEHEPFRVGGNSPRETLDNMARPKDVPLARVSERMNLLNSLGRPGGADAAPLAQGVGRFQSRAAEIALSDGVREAFDLEREPAEARARFGEGPHRHGPHPGKSLLLARRLVEAGVSVVTVGVHNWDTHSTNFATLRELLPPLDRALAALVNDLDDRGLLGDVAIVMAGEFGRTPRIGDQTPDGRGHWPEAGFLWCAGGGLKTGQVIGQTDAKGEAPVGNPIRLQNVLATLYRLLDIDASQTLLDHNGRPQYVLENREPLAELL